MFEIFLLCYYYLRSTYMSFLTLLYMFILSQCHGDIEKTNPGPRKLKKSLSFCRWNRNSLPAHNFSKLTQLKAYILMHKHDFICLSETHLDFLVPDSLLEIDGYNLLRDFWYHPKIPKKVELLFTIRSHFLLESYIYLL